MFMGAELIERAMRRRDEKLEPATVENLEPAAVETLEPQAAE
jgi:hypothetical protein